MESGKWPHKLHLRNSAYQYLAQIKGKRVTNKEVTRLLQASPKRVPNKAKGMTEHT